MPGDCVIATQKPRPNGYATTSRGKGTCFLVHRLAWEDVHGPIPEGLEIHHLCEVKNCVNVEHLALVTRAAHNALRRKEFCLHGHDLSVTRRSSPTNTYCSECNREN